MSSLAMNMGIVAGIISLLAYIPRARQIIRENSRSSNTWIIWTLSNFLIFLSSYALGARSTLWVPLAYFIGSAFMAILSLFYKAEGWTTLHKWLLAVAILSAIRWWYFDNPTVALGFNVFIYFIGYVSIIKAKLKSTKKRTWILTWGLYFAGATINLLAVREWSFGISAYPIIIFVMNAVVFSITVRNFFRQKKLAGQIEESAPENQTDPSDSEILDI